MGEFKLGDMEDGVYRLHSIRESEHEEMSIRLCYDCKGFRTLVGELLRGVCRSKVLSFHVDFISYFEI